MAARWSRDVRDWWRKSRRAARHAAGFNLPRRHPRQVQRLKAVFTEGNRIAAGGVAFHLAALAFAKFDPFGH